MTEKELKKYEIIGKVINGTITKNEAERILFLSRRQIDRLIIKYKNEGKNGFIHKNNGNHNAYSLDENIKQEIITLYLNEYYDYNFSHFYEKVISNRYTISFATLQVILLKADIISPEAQHKTKSEYNKKMKEITKNKTITKEQEKLFETRQIQEEQSHTRKSNLYYQFGEEVQMDASEDLWFGNIKSQLHLAVDKATKITLFGWFDYEETMRAYFTLLFNTIYIYGIPRKIKTDYRKVFCSKNGENTHFGKACEYLNIKLDSSSNPRFKSNVERENKTFKGRLKAELRHENITTIEEANRYLNDIFIPDINKRFAYEIDNTKTLMRKNPYSEENLSLIIAERYERTIDTGSCIRFNNKYYIPTTINGQKVYYKQKTPVIVIVNYHNELWCLIEQEYYTLKEIEMKEKVEYNPAKAAAELQEEIKTERKKYIPPKNHPWRQFKI